MVGGVKQGDMVVTMASKDKAAQAPPKSEQLLAEEANEGNWPPDFGTHTSHGKALCGRKRDSIERDVPKQPFHGVWTNEDL